MSALDEVHQAARADTADGRHPTGRVRARSGQFTEQLTLLGGWAIIYMPLRYAHLDPRRKFVTLKGELLDTGFASY